jgi:hypothetical protein
MVTLATSLPLGTDQLGSPKRFGVISGVGATRTLKANETGSVCLFDRTAGNIYTLPPPMLGLDFTFFVSVSVTSSDIHKVITDAATTFLLGAVTMVTIATASPAGFSANGTSIVSLTLNATTDGGLLGGWARFIGLNSTQWAVYGLLVGSGTIETPFQTT